jgi:hypothetical protein
MQRSVVLTCRSEHDGKVIQMEEAARRVPRHIQDRGEK